MKSLIICFLLFTSCQRTEIPAEIQGKWVLEKISNGFSGIELEGDEEIGYSSMLNIGEKFILTRNNTRELELAYSIGKVEDQPAFLLEDNTYIWYSIQEEKGKDYLMLYEQVPNGAVLADGSYYFYGKVK